MSGEELTNTDVLELAQRLIADENTDPVMRRLAALAVATIEPNGPPVEAAVTDSGELACPNCGCTTFAYEEGCIDYRSPGGQDAATKTVTVIWAADGTAESGDSNPGLICDSYRSGGCGTPIILPEGWDINYG